jgi:hypothetical protein
MFCSIFYVVFEQPLHQTAGHSLKLHDVGTVIVRRLARSLKQGKQPPVHANHFLAELFDGSCSSATKLAPTVQVCMTPDTDGNVWFSSKMSDAASTSSSALNLLFKKGWEAEFLKEKRCTGISVIGAATTGVYTSCLMCLSAP